MNHLIRHNMTSHHDTFIFTTQTYYTSDDDIFNMTSQEDSNVSTTAMKDHALLMTKIAEEYENQTHWFSFPTVVALIVAYCVVISIGLVGNVLVVVVMLRRKDLRTSRNFYILNLSFCDIIMCSVCMPFSLVKYTLKRWELGAVMCRVVPALATVDVFVSTFTIIAIACDRYRSIVHASGDEGRPQHQGLSRGRGGSAYRVICKLVVIWIVALGLATPLFIFHSLSTENVFGKSVFHTCIEVWPHDRFREIYSVLVSLLQYMAPTVAISVLHALICNFLRRRIHDSPNTESQIRRSQRELKRHRKNLALLTSIAITFSLAWLPLTLLNLTADWSQDITIFGLFQERQFYLVHALCLLLAMTSSAFNPLLYGWFNSNFRKAFLEILCCAREATNQETSSLKAGAAGGLASASGSGSGSGVRKKKVSEQYESFQKTSSRNGSRSSSSVSK